MREAAAATGGPSVAKWRLFHVLFAAALGELSSAPPPPRLLGPVGRPRAPAEQIAATSRGRFLEHQLADRLVSRLSAPPGSSSGGDRRDLQRHAPGHGKPY